MGKPKAPAAPDYAAAANAQGIANVNSAVATNRLNQANQVGPDGSLTYSYGTPESGQGYTDPQTGQWIPQVTATTTLSPEQQRLYDQNNTISTNLNDLAVRGIGYVDQASQTPIDQSKLPSLAGGLAAPTFQSSYDFSNVGAMPSSDDFAGQRDKITEAMMQRLQPFLDRQRDQTNTRLANQGITNGSEAWKWDQDTLNRGENDQRIAALLAGDQEQQNLFNNALGIRQQGVGEAMSQGDMFNRSREAGFNTGLASSQFNNQARAQAVQEQDYFKNQPLNMLNALRSGNQTQMPQFGSVTAGAQVGAAPVYNATNDAYQAALERFKIQSAQSGGLMGGLASLGGAAITKFSDRRLKTHIRKIGELASGLGVYAYNYLWSKAPEVGVMADEVAKVKPAALGPIVLGYQTVNYGAL